MIAAGFWRRTLAFAVDMLLLASLGALWGSMAFDFLAHLGVWGRLIGLLVGLVYFGIQDSRVFRGQTLGKRLLGIAVRRIDGSCLGLLASCGRFTLLWIPFFIEGWPLTPRQGVGIIGVALSLENGDRPRFPFIP